MQIRTFTAPTAAAALAVVRDVLGPEAAILETRRAGDSVEVVAAAERRPAPTEAIPPAPPAPPLALPAERLRERLHLLGFTELMAERLAAAVQANLDPVALRDEQVAWAYVRELIAALLPTAAITPASRDVRVLALVGATGVGKTTTLAKLAAREAMDGGAGVVLASADDARLGGAEQTAAFARLLGAPFQLLRTGRDLASARARVLPGGLLLIDTPGIARGDRRGLDRLAGLLTGVRREEIELLLAADSDAEALSEILRRFRPLRPATVGITRVDEAVRPGGLISALARAGLPLRHIGCGPNVPDDLQPADSRTLAAWALPLGAGSISPAAGKGAR